MTFRVLDPTNEAVPASGEAATRLLSLRGTTVGFVSNGKEGTKEFFTHLGRILEQEHGVDRVVHRIKSNYSAPADKHIVDEMRSWHAVVTGIGD
jgi:hypothetical protein